MLVRPATRGDLDGCTRIYNHYVETSVATFDTQSLVGESAERWFDCHQNSVHPLLVAEQAGAVVGYGSLSPWSTKDAYSKTCEVSVFVSPNHQRRGAGEALLNALTRAAAPLGYRCLVARIEADNNASLALFRRAGFSSVGIMHDVGFKFGRWLDVEVMELLVESVDTT